MILSLAVLVELRLVIDRHRQTQTDPGPLPVPRIASRGKNEKRKVSGPGRMDGARFCVPLDTKYVTSETFFPANLLACIEKAKPNKMKLENTKPNKTNNTKPK